MTTTLAGGALHALTFRDGAGASAQFYFSRGVAIDPSGGFALVAVRAWLGLAASLVTPRKTRHPTDSAHAIGCEQFFPEMVPVTTLHAIFWLLLIQCVPS